MSNAAIDMTTDAPSLGELTKHRHTLREMKRDLQTQLKDIDAALKDNEQQMLDALDGQDLEATRVDGIAISVSEQTYPSVTDWDAFYQFIKDNDAMYMLERRPAAAPYREMLQMEAPVPGVEPFTKRTINMRKA